MLYPLQPPKTAYPSLQSLQVEQVEPISRLSIEQSSHHRPSSFLSNYARSELFPKLKQQFTYQQTHEFNQIAQILSRYVHFKLNPIYSSVSNLPLKIFACGRCKETFFTGVQYILHCVDLGCQINHQRSTFFVHSKDTLKRVKNQDIQQILTQNHIHSSEYVFFGKNCLQLANYQFRRKPQVQLERNSDFQCGRCKTTQFRFNGLFYFLNHCFGICKSYNLKENSHQLIIFQNTQTQQQFSQDIKNFWLNVNIMNLFGDSYIKMKKNGKIGLQSKKSHEQTCANCKLSFETEEQFLKHALFQCHEKPSDSSTSIISRKQCPIMTIPQPSYKYKCQLISRQTIERQPNSNEKSGKIIAKINKRYDNVWKGYEHIYFCASCYNMYTDLGLYVAHFDITCCDVNNKFNSHFLYDESGLMLTQQQLRQLVNEERDIKECFETVLNSIKMAGLLQKINMISKETGRKIVIKQLSRCGKCGLNKNMAKNSYLNHIVKRCKDPHNAGNSHKIVYKEKIIVLSEVVHFLKDAKLCLQIMNTIKNKKTIRIEKNINFSHQMSLGLSSRTYCGKCQKWMGSPYQFYFHCLKQCNGINEDEPSHFFYQQSYTKNLCQNLYRVIKYRGYWDDKFRVNLKIPISNNETSHVNNIRQVQFEQKSRFQNIPKVQSESQQLEDQLALKQPSKKQPQNITHPKQPSFINDSRNNLPNPIIKNQIKQPNPQQSIEPICQSQSYLDIYPNIDYDSEKLEDIKFYCGKCQLPFKKKQSFIDHIFECETFSHPESSHFILSPTKFNEINWDHLFKAKDLNQSCQKSYPSYLQEHKNVVCGCGATNITCLPAHMSQKHSMVIPQGTSHFALRLKIDKVKTPVYIFLPYEPRPENENNLFVCPCNPQKKLPYRVFANHILKRHEGKTPIFYMRKDLNQIPEKNELE